MNRELIRATEDFHFRSISGNSAGELFELGLWTKKERFADKIREPLEGGRGRELALFPAFDHTRTELSQRAGIGRLD